MNNSIWVPALLLFVTGYVLTSCDSPGQIVENAEANVVIAQEELAIARQNYLANVEIYQQQAAEQMAGNNKKIDMLNAKIAGAEGVSITDYHKTIDELNKQNSDLKLRLDTYHEDCINKWEAFKIDLSSDMEKLGVVMKDLTFNNN